MKVYAGDNGKATTDPVVASLWRSEGVIVEEYVPRSELDALKNQEPVSFVSQSSLDDLRRGRCSGIVCGTYSATYERTLPVYLAAGASPKLVEGARKVWECNECGSQEYTMGVSETDVQNLSCGSCGACEWHVALEGEK